MEEFDTTIEDLESARTFFQAMGCSSFHMHREYPARFEEYKALKIQRRLEIEWIKESLAQYADMITSANNNDIWWIHSRMDELARNLKSIESIEIVYRSTVSLAEVAPPMGKLLIAETINGRQDLEFRPGLIFLSCDLGRRDLGEKFASLAFRFGQDAKRELSSEVQRCESSLSRTGKICEVLGIHPNCV